MSSKKAPKNPWTKAQRAQLSAILHPNPNDPPDFLPTAEVAWAKTGFEMPAEWNEDADRDVIERAQDATDDVSTALTDYFVASRGLEAALATYTCMFERSNLGFDDFRKHCYAADEATFARVRTWLTEDWDDLSFGTKVARAFVLSRDPSVAASLIDPMPEWSFVSGAALVAVGDPTLAAKILGASPAKAWGIREVFDLVEMYGGAAQPLIAELLARFEGKAAGRKPFEQAMKLAAALAESSDAPAVALEVPAAVAGPTLPEEADYKGIQAVVAGKFDLPDELVRARLAARGIWTSAKTPAKQSAAYFEGEGAKPDLRAKAEKHGVPIFGPAEVATLLATPLFRFRERIEARIRSELDGVLDVATWYVGEPADAARLDAAEKTLGVLDPTLRALYAQCDGLQLRSDWSKELTRQKLEPTLRSWGDVGDSSGGELGRGSASTLAILPLNELLESQSFFGDPKDGRGREVQIGRRRVDLEYFLRNAYLFDFWYDYYPVALFVDRERGESWVVFGDDHGAVWDDPDAQSVESYLERLSVHGLGGRSRGKRSVSRNV
ncbi:MAG: hypothetical protein H6721_02960 [Sandaracinus sp.]|nr:hypothetical protein [Sandaracinus sp.]MCB9620392.1 hypothetical protein [Sandaracinus sp.]MCB9631095.1 hypothetical protein [Sandaracinus sp.]